MLRRSTLTVMVSVCLLLGGYTFLLHHKLSFAEDKRGFTVTEAVVSQDDQAMDMHWLQAEIQQQAAMLQNVSGLADEVASLAQALDSNQPPDKEQTPDAPSNPQERVAAKRLLTPRATKEPEIPEAPGWNETPVEQIVVDPYKQLTQAECAERRGFVKAAMQHAWSNYAKYAFGHDELMPRSLRGKDPFGGLGATILDSLDTLWLMDMQAEYKQARDWVAYDLNFTRCEELVGRLLVAYDTQTGIPYNSIVLDTLEVQNPTWTRRSSTLSEFGSEQLEFAKLSMHSGNPIYNEKAESVIQYLYEKYPEKGLMPLYLNPKSGRFTTTRLSLGALGDSYYEYLLKMWVMKGRSQEAEMYRIMWEKAMDEMIEKLVFTSSPEGLTYVAEFERKHVKHKMDHLVCFVPAMLALGSHTGAVSGVKADHYMQLAENLTETCWQFYAVQPTGLSPEYVTFREGQGMRSSVHVYLMRPEAVEAFFVLWQLTGNTKYREYGWGVFQAIEKWCKVEHGYAGLRDVRKAPPKHDDTQQSFFLAETLKYLYLMYGNNDEISLDEWVFNTEAHPLRIVQSKAPTDVTTDNAARQNVQDEVNKAPLLVDKAPVNVEQTQGLNELDQAHVDVDKVPEVLNKAPDVLDERTEQ
ncbi:MAG: mannosyl-oligosaccharide 1 [Trebouxia sp. A1-2]|nr:MAG: mannosyl-oligosaccharide 1 [Trebouxia sp. A1-2]